MRVYWLITALTAVLLVLFCLVFRDASRSALHGVSDRFPVGLSEVVTSNRSYPNAEGVVCDYIELRNFASYDVDLGGYQLTDGNASHRYVFPKGTVLRAGEYLTVWCDRSRDGYAAFGLSSKGGETVSLLTSKGVTVDSVVTEKLGPDEAMTLIDGVWVHPCVPSPGAASETSPAALTENGPVRISELMAANRSYPVSGGFYDWIELYNDSSETAELSGYTLSDELSERKYVFPAGTELPPKGYLVIPCIPGTEDPAAAPFGLSRDGGEDITLRTGEGLLCSTVTTLPLGEDEAQTAGDETTLSATPGYENTEKGRADWLASLDVSEGCIVISEIMPSNTSTLPDENGLFSDWLELENRTDDDISLLGWSLSDDREEPVGWRFPDVTLPAGERMVIFCGGEGALRTDFSLYTGGETVLLTAPGRVPADEVSWKRAASDCSLSLEPSTGERAFTLRATPGYENSDDGYAAFCASLAPRDDLAIWEVMSYNDKYLAQNGKCYDFIELKNISDHDVSLSEYSLSDASEEPGRFRLPDETLAPGEMRLIFLSGDETLSTEKYFHAGFSLNGGEDSVFLFREDALSDFAHLFDIPVGMTLGRVEGENGFFPMPPTPGEENLPGAGLSGASSGEGAP